MKKKYQKGKGRTIANACKLRYKERNPKKIAARTKVGNAVRDGKLIKKPCEVCGAIKVHAHHTDYDKPLEVMWLCPTHHEAWHRMNGPGLNGE